MQASSAQQRQNSIGRDAGNLPEAEAQLKLSF
jgi:hypothetical protein